MAQGFNRKEFGDVIVQRNYDPSWSGVRWRADQAIYFGVRGSGCTTALDLDQAKAARDHLTELIEEIEENLDKPVKTTYGELLPGDVYVFADPAALDAPKYIRLTDARSWSTVTNRIIGIGQQEPDRTVWIIKETGV